MSVSSDKNLIVEFVNFLREHGHPDLNIDRFPDHEQRKMPDIDALAGAFAIEHTSIDTVPQQRQRSAWFMQAAGDLEAEFNRSERRPGFFFSITLPYEAIDTGQDWNGIKETFRSWISSNLFSLPEGVQMMQELSGVPFEFRVKKSRVGPKGVFFSRFSPTDTSLPGRIRDLLDRKAKRLMPYKTRGKITVLLVESDDIAFMNDPLLVEAIRSAYNDALPQGVDQLWFADTAFRPDLQFRDLTKAVVDGMTGRGDR